MKAFPHTKLERGADGRTWDISEVRYEGMDLRDYFAAKAINVLYSVYAKQGFTDYGQLAYHSYEIADAMMKAREK